MNNRLGVLFFVIATTCVAAQISPWCAFCGDFAESTTDQFVVDVDAPPSAILTFIDFMDTDPQSIATILSGDLYANAFGWTLVTVVGTEDVVCVPAYAPVYGVDQDTFIATWNPIAQPDVAVDTTEIFFFEESGYWNSVIYHPIDYFGYGTQSDLHNEYYVGHVSYARKNVVGEMTGIWLQARECVAMYLNGMFAVSWCGSAEWGYVETSEILGGTVPADEVYGVDIFYTSMDMHTERMEGLKISDVGTPVGSMCTHVETPTFCSSSSDCFTDSACVCEFCTPCIAYNQCDLATVDTTNCVHETIQGCCVDDSGCSDTKYCMLDHTCANVVCEPFVCWSVVVSGHECVYTPIPDCCTVPSDCPPNELCIGGTCTECIANDVCDNPIATQTECVHEPIPGCCLANGSCPLTQYCTVENTCVDVVCEPRYCQTSNVVAHECVYTQIPGCCSVSAECQPGESCVEGTCTSCIPNDICDLPIITPGGCVHEVIPGCCLMNSMCPDTQYCTPAQTCADVVCDTQTCLSSSVINHECVYTPIPGCCSVSAECPYGEACITGMCTPCVANNACDYAEVQPTECVHSLAYEGCCIAHNECPEGSTCEYNQCTVCEPTPYNGCDIVTIDPINGCVHTPAPDCTACTFNDECPANNACVGWKCIPCFSTFCSHAQIGFKSCIVTPNPENIGEVCEVSTTSEKYCSTLGSCVEYQDCSATSDCPQPGYVCVASRCIAVTREYVARHGLGGDIPMLSVDSNIAWVVTSPMYTTFPSMFNHSVASRSTSAFWTVAGRDGTEERVAHHSLSATRVPYNSVGAKYGELRCRGPSDCTPTTNCTKKTMCIMGVCSYNTPGPAPIMTPCRIGISSTEPNWAYGLCNGAGVCERDNVTSPTFKTLTECQEYDPVVTPCKNVPTKTIHYMKTNGTLRYYCNYTTTIPRGTPCLNAEITNGPGYCTAGGDCVPFCDPFETPGCCTHSSQCPYHEACIEGGICAPCLPTNGCDSVTILPNQCVHSPIPGCVSCVDSSQCGVDEACVNNGCSPCVSTLCGIVTIQPTECSISIAMEKVGEVCELSLTTEKYCSTSGTCVEFQECIAKEECPQPGYICVDNKCVALTREYISRHAFGGASTNLLASHTGGFYSSGTYVWSLTALQSLNVGYSYYHGPPDPTSGYWEMAGGDSTISLALAMSSDATPIPDPPYMMYHPDTTPDYFDSLAPGLGIVLGDLRCRGPSDCTPTSCGGFFAGPYSCGQGVCGAGVNPITRETAPCNGAMWTPGYGVCSSTGSCVSGDPNLEDASDCPAANSGVSPCKLAPVKTLHYMTTSSTATYYCNYTIAPKGTPCSPAMYGGSGYCTAMGDCIAL